MKVSVDGVELFSLSDIQKKVLCNDIPNHLLEEDLKRRIEYIIRHKYEQCFKRLKEEWDSKLAANGVKAVPTDPDAYAQLVFSQSNYKCRATRDAKP
jgi:hypothetical protein